jgi:HlyD family secretion protein
MRVPSQALRFTPGGVGANAVASGAIPGGPQTQVWVLRGGSPTAVPVDIGLDDESFVEIVGGNLKPGDPVIVAEQHQAAGRAVPLPRL